MTLKLSYRAVSWVWLCIATTVAASTNGYSCDTTLGFNSTTVNDHRGSRKGQYEMAKQGKEGGCGSINPVDSVYRTAGVEIQADDFVQVLLDWIAKNSSYTTDEVPLPSIVIMTAREITTEYYRENSESIPEGGVDKRILAFYDAVSGANGVIYLRMDDPELQIQSGPLKVLNINMLAQAAFSVERSKRKDPQVSLFDGNPIMTERLVHELVHHIQHQTGLMETFICVARSEKEAYRIGGLYFNQLRIEDPMTNRNFWADLYSLC